MRSFSAWRAVFRSTEGLTIERTHLEVVLDAVHLVIAIRKT